VSLVPDLNERLQRIRLLAMDVDGVLTDGGVYIFENGEEFRRFDIKDGLGLKRAMERGIQVVWISAGSCEATLTRAKNLGVQGTFLQVEDKAQFLEQYCKQNAIPLETVAYIGDDLTDLKIMQRVTLPCAPADADECVKEAALLITTKPGGHGAVREICDMLIHSREV